MRSLLLIFFVGCASHPNEPHAATPHPLPQRCQRAVPNLDYYVFVEDPIGGATKWGDSFLPPGRRHQPLPPDEQWVYPCVSRDATTPSDASLEPEVAQYLEDLERHPERYGLDAGLE